MEKHRILEKIQELDTYLNELKTIKPKTYDEFQKIEKKRSCERLLQLLIETVIDISNLMIKHLQLGLPRDINDVFKKIQEHDIITSAMEETLKEMRAFRNILVHRYDHIDNELVYKNLDNLEDFIEFKHQILAFLKNNSNKK